MKTTEQNSYYDGLEQMNTLELLTGINQEDQKVALAIKKIIPNITALIEVIVSKMRTGGRLFYIGAGTSGRLGIVDASECPPTFGVAYDKVIGIIAGGDTAIRKAVEFAEDDTEQAWKDLKTYEINQQDVLIGIAASGSTPYVIGGLQKANENNIVTGCIVCNEHSPIADLAQYPIEIIVGPEFVTGSTRMKAGTAQKLVLNMISTATMIRLGHVIGNKMVDMQLTNYKLVDRAIQMITNITQSNSEQAKKLLEQHGSVRAAINAWEQSPKAVN